MFFGAFMYIAEKDNEFYLNLQFRKAAGAKSEGLGYTDNDGNYIFELEASNENLDLQGQIVLQRALLESEEFFLKNGVISNDHQHKRKDRNGNMIVDNTMVIGEPIAVRKEGKSTIVKGKLYGNVASAKPFIDLLKAKSNRVRGSVGGILPKIVKDNATGAEKITSVLWNDLALTCSPVNSTVGYAVFAKSMNQAEIVKALEAGYGTDSATKTDGNALILEDVEKNTLVATESGEKETLRALLAALQTGEINGERQAEIFLENNGFTAEQSRAAVREIIKEGGLAMKKSVSETLKEMMKSLTGKCGDDSEKDNALKNGAAGGGEDDNNDINLDDNGDKEEKEKGDDDDEVVDGTELMKSLAEENGALHKSIGEMQKQIADMSEGMLSLGEMVMAIGGQKMPPRSVTKSMNGSENAGGSGVPKGRPTQEDFEKVQDVLQKSVMNGEIDLQKSSVMSSEFQRQMATGVPMSKNTWDFLSKKINGGK